MAMRFEAVLPGPFNPAAFVVEMEQTLERLATGILLDFERTTSTWSTQPAFEMEFASNPRYMEAHVFCDALRDGDRVKGTTGPQPAPVNLVYYFLNGGTAVRYAKMTLDFVPKSRVGIIGSFPGRGGVAKVDPRDPQPGIEARKWDEAIAKKYRLILPTQLGAALARGARGCGHAF